MLAWRWSTLYVNLGASPHTSPGPLGLYLHLPFCDHKCAYCDFNSYAGLDHLIPAYVDALVRDLALWAPLTHGWAVQTVFFGGGTPSLTPPALLCRILDTVRTQCSLAPDAEISLEANPGTVGREYLTALRDLGINRLSIGVQSFDDRQLRLLDRIHDAGQATAAFRAARAAGFDNVNLDLMFGLQAQDLDGWQRNLRRACELGPEHLSLYALTVEPGTKLAGQIARGSVPEPDADLQADMYEAAQDAMASAGYLQYEISNWAKPGRECRHNLIYWRNQPYLGLGAGAHSCFLGRRFAMVRAPGAYIERVVGSVPLTGWGSPLAGFQHVVDEQVLDRATDASDTLILGLRLNEGVDIAAFERRFGLALQQAAGSQLDQLCGYGLLERAGGRLRLTQRGRLLSNEVFVRLLPEELSIAKSAVTAR
jgi:oxygen-independent coproporphyrinogen-3 oxidase